MSNLEVAIIIILVIGVIASNLAVLKYSAKFKMPQFSDPKKLVQKSQTDKNDDPPATSDEQSRSKSDDNLTVNPSDKEE